MVVVGVVVVAVGGDGGGCCDGVGWAVKVNCHDVLPHMMAAIRNCLVHMVTTVRIGVRSVGGTMHCTSRLNKATDRLGMVGNWGGMHPICAS